MGFLSVNIEFSGREALLVGAGRVGRRKLADLLGAGARVTVVEPAPDPSLEALAAGGRIGLEKEFSESLLDRRPWVFLAVGDRALSERIAGLARGRSLMVEAADGLVAGDFTSPALVDFPPLRITVSTLGASPALSARVAAELREKYAGFGGLAALLGRLRPLLLGADMTQAERSLVFRALAGDGELTEIYRGLGGDGGRAADRIRAVVSRVIAPAELPDDFPLP